MRGLKAFVAGVSAMLVTPFATAASAQVPPSVGTQSAERMADLIRLWNYVRLFDVDPRAMSRQWEMALSDAAAPALAAADDRDLKRAIDAMMAKLDAAPPPGRTAAKARTDVPAFRVVDERAIASCVSIAAALASGSEPSGDVSAFGGAAKKVGLIFDCRRFPEGAAGDGPRQIFETWFPQAIPEYISRPIARGSMRMRMHDGYPPDEGNSSGGYARGTIDQDLGLLVPEKPSSASGPRMVLVIDESSPNPARIAGALQASGQVRVVAQGRAPAAGLSQFTSAHVQAAVKTETYLTSSGREEFRADACLPGSASDAAVASTARAMLNGLKGPPCPKASLRSPNANPASPEADKSRVPSLGERMVALAKLWGTFQYFHAYKELDSQPWESELEKFVPIFAAADTRAEYEDAVSRLAARADDSHVGVGGTTLTALSPKRYAPPIYVRPVEAGFAVAGLHDLTLADRLHVGDEILAVDGRKAADVAADAAPIIAASTPQALAQREAMVLLAGEQGSVVRLVVRRGEAAPFEIDLQRSMPMYRAAGQPETKEPSFRRIGADIGYIDLSRITPPEADTALDQLMDTKAIVFDLRGYPKGTAWVIAPRLALDGREGAIAAQFRRPIYLGPSEPEENWKSFTQSIPVRDKPRYRGKLIVLIDDRAISQSEYTAQFFEAAANPVFVGTPTNGTNGDVTSVDLPGGLYVSFTGHDVRHADGRRLQRVGFQPNVRVAPTFKGMEAGRDEVLEAGLAIAREP